MHNRMWGTAAQKAVEVASAPSNEILVHERPSILEQNHNHIYFYSDIEREKALQLNYTIRMLSGDIVHDSIIREHEFVCPIFLHIFSYGGDIFSGLSCMDEIILIDKRVPVNTVVDGCCASAATFLSVVGRHRQIKSNSFMLIHQLSSGMWGKFSEFQDEMENLKQMMKIITDIYSKYTKIPKKELDKIMKHDLWWDAKTCLKYGLVDEII